MGGGAGGARVVQGGGGGSPSPYGVRPPTLQTAVPLERRHQRPHGSVPHGSTARLWCPAYAIAAPRRPPPLLRVPRHNSTGPDGEWCSCTGHAVPRRGGRVWHRGRGRARAAKGKPQGGGGVTRARASAVVNGAARSPTAPCALHLPLRPAPPLPRAKCSSMQSSPPSPPMWGIRRGGHGLIPPPPVLYAYGGVGGGGYHKASVSDCLPLAAPMGLSHCTF